MTGRTAAPAGGNWVVTATPAVAGLATLCAATALSSVLDGVLWMVHLAVAIVVVAGSGVLLRSSRLPAPLVVLGQVVALLCLLVALYTTSGVLVFLPGPESLQDLGAVLGNAIGEVQTGVPPVPDSQNMRCLVMVAIGLVAVVVDALAVGAAAPAASGLVLLCVFAVPASLADEMLPLWTFVFGAAAFALLLAVDGQHRHEAWRGRLPGAGQSGSGPAATAVAGMAVVIALLAGGSLTLVGTVGRLPGTGDELGGGSGGLGIDPITELRGMLNQGQSREMFRVRDLPESAYLRAMTLPQYVPDKGWTGGGDLSGGVPARGDLPPQPGDPRDGEVVEVKIEPVTWLDYWLPVYGRPRSMPDVDEAYQYDAGRGMVYATRARKSGTYTLRTVLDTPSADTLRRATGPVDVDPAYLEAPGVEDRVVRLARDIVAGEDNQFDRASALYRYFTDGTQGFTYTTETTNDMSAGALEDFVLNGKKGFCEQYASAMAIMARSVGIPARVALGFTAGYPTGDFQTITSQDAHAWVEVYFPGHGWMTFDPTPLSDGRGVAPPYISGNEADDEEDGSSAAAATTTTTTTAPDASASASAAPDAQGQDGTSQTAAPTPAWHLITLAAAVATALLLLGLLVFGGVWLTRTTRLRPALLAASAVLWAIAVALVLALVSWWLAALVIVVALVVAPALVRAWRRRERLRAVAGLGPGAAGAAWQELVAESVDRGTRVPSTETIRVAARRLAKAHNLDDQGRDGLRTVVGAVERAWYSTHQEADPALPKAVDDVRASLGRNAPLALRAKVLPRSVLQPKPPAESDPDD
ncbi:transglutaminase TgpA family protein [Saccharothrix sp. Mg75]|uniref:transglutaminase TgpA family protein n=1 Tax=Saccharothrix sp. Mg75 TaxID=3445357 RepID=UPI003EECAA4B